MALHKTNKNEFLLWIEKTWSNLDWAIISENFIWPLFLVIVAAASGAFFQLLFKKQEAKKDKIKEAQLFNEAVTYNACMLEDILTNVENNIKKAFDEEAFYLMDIQISKNKEQEEITGISFTGIPNLQTLEEKYLIEKIANIGKYPDVCQAFYRTKQQIINFEKIAQERIELIKAFTPKSFEPVLTEFLIDRLSEVHQRTQLLVLYSDGAWDGVAYIGYRLKEISEDVKTDLKKVNVKDVKVYHTKESLDQKQLRLEHKETTEDLPMGKGRFRHMDKYD